MTHGAPSSNPEPDVDPWVEQAFDEIQNAARVGEKNGPTQIVSSPEPAEPIDFEEPPLPLTQKQRDRAIELINATLAEEEEKARLYDVPVPKNIAPPEAKITPANAPISFDGSAWDDPEADKDFTGIIKV